MSHEIYAHVTYAMVVTVSEEKVQLNPRYHTFFLKIKKCK